MRRFVGVLAAAGIAVVGLFAQAQYGSLSGRAMDSSGAVIPGVSIRIVNAENGHALTVTTGPDGAYQAPQLLPGVYDIRVEHAGFKLLRVSGVQVGINQNVAQDLTLEVGAVTESLNVQASAAMVDTVTGAVGHIVENKEVTELPLNARNVFDLVTLTPVSYTHLTLPTNREV